MFVQEIKHKKKGSNTNYQNSSAISESESGSKNPFPTSFISSLLVANFFTHQTQSSHKLAEDETQNQKRKTKEKKMEFNSAFFVFRRVSDFEVNGTRQNDQKWRSYDGSPSARLRNCSKSIILLLGIHPVGNWKLVVFKFENWGAAEIGLENKRVFLRWPISTVAHRKTYGPPYIPHFQFMTCDWPRATRWIGNSYRKCSNLQRLAPKFENQKKSIRIKIIIITRITNKTKQ